MYKSSSVDAPLFGCLLFFLQTPINSHAVNILCVESDLVKDGRPIENSKTQWQYTLKIYVTKQNNKNKITKVVTMKMTCKKIGWHWHGPDTQS